METKPTYNRPRVYLAGFDVFRPDAIAHGRYLHALCDSHSLQGQYPFDVSIPAEDTPQATARAIYLSNAAMLRQSDAVLANLNFFRGLEPDSGTVFEVGMEVALGIPVWAYFEPTASLRATVPHDEQGYDSQGFLVEDFELPRNLMLACSWAGASPTVEQAVPALADYLRKVIR